MVRNKKFCPSFLGLLYLAKKTADLLVIHVNCSVMSLHLINITNVKTSMLVPHIFKIILVSFCFSFLNGLLRPLFQSNLSSSALAVFRCKVLLALASPFFHPIFWRSCGFLSGLLTSVGAKFTTSSSTQHVLKPLRLLLLDAPIDPICPAVRWKPIWKESPTA